MSTATTRTRKKNRGLMYWFSRMRGHGVVGNDGKQGLWVYFEDDAEGFAHYGYQDDQQQPMRDYYLQ